MFAIEHGTELFIFGHQLFRHIASSLKVLVFAAKGGNESPEFTHLGGEGLILIRLTFEIVLDPPHVLFLLQYSQGELLCMILQGHLEIRLLLRQLFLKPAMRALKLSLSLLTCKLGFLDLGPETGR